MEVVTTMSVINWPDIFSDLDSATPGSDTDELIDQIAKTARNSLSQEATPVMVKVFELADNVFVKQRVALTLAKIAPENDISAVDVLINGIENNRHDEFLYIQLIKALGILAKRSSLAHAEISRILLRLKCIDSPFLLIQTVKIIGQLEHIRKTPGFRDKLTELEQSEDFGVQAEVFQQKALLALMDAILSHDFDSLEVSLKEARLMFLRSHSSEEIREDAEVFKLLLDLMLEFFNSRTTDRADVVIEIRRKNKAILELISNPYAQSWYGYRSSIEQLRMVRILRISDAFTRIVTSASISEEWTNFDETLVELASLYVLMMERDERELDQLDKSFSEIASQVLLPKLGPLLLKATGRVRFEKVIQNHVLANGENETTQALRAVYNVALAKEYNTDLDVDTNVILKEANRLGESPNFFINNLLAALESGKVEDWLKQHDYPTPTLSIDYPELFGNTPQIDIAVRTLLDGIRLQLKEYPPQQWSRLIEVCESVIHIVHQVRDELPLYALRSPIKDDEPRGKGQNATERDLQDDLFKYLRIRYGSSVGYEISAIGGGRSDTGLKFTECEFPIECKAEYKNVERQHIHESYITQTDIYASVRDRVAFLIILDLRDANSGRPPKKSGRKTAANKTDESKELYSLYSLKDSFWVDGLSGDPHLQNPQKNSVVVGLVPGNRPKPSSTTRYSRKPSS
jgi:hypothetical protein